MADDDDGRMLRSLVISDVPEYLVDPLKSLISNEKLGGGSLDSFDIDAHESKVFVTFKDSQGLMSSYFSMLLFVKYIFFEEVRPIV